MSKGVLVIGGGISGIKATLDLAQLGIETILVERTSELGGTYAKLGVTYPNSVDAKITLEQYLQTLKALQAYEWQEGLFEWKSFIKNQKKEWPVMLLR